MRTLFRDTNIPRDTVGERRGSVVPVLMLLVAVVAIVVSAIAAAAGSARTVRGTVEAAVVLIAVLTIVWASHR